MTTVYDEKDLERAGGYRKKMLRWMGILLALTVVLVACSLMVRLKWLSIVLTVLGGAALIFLWDMKLRPVQAYRKFRSEVLQGPTRELEGIVVRRETDPSDRGGLAFYRLIVNVDPDGDATGERQLYLDAQKDWPPLEAGDTVALRYQEADVIALKKPGGTEA